MVHEVLVDLGARSYPIRIDSDHLAGVGEFCRGRNMTGRCLLVTDRNVDELVAEPVLASLDQAGYETCKAVVPAGESSKSGEHLFNLYTEALAGGLDRTSFVVALGGGVVGDLAGYMAASYLRGIPYVQVPTTVVAMVDSAVGGKTGINLEQGKNLIGSFYQPAGVFIDLAVLSSLPEREYLSGLAEVIKYGIIWDRDFFELLERKRTELLQRDAHLLGDVVARSCAIKAHVVQEDEREGGLRAILNYGHTLGHALEKASGYNRFLHGEAIAVGMNYATRLSAAERGLAPDQVERIRELIGGVGLPLVAPDLAWPVLREAIAIDKKTIGHKPKFVLADEIGRVAFGCEVEESHLEEVWNGLGE